MQNQKDDIVEQVTITDYSKFVFIENNHYGGYQDWLYSQGHTTKFWADRACGVVAAANISYHLAKYHDKPNLYLYNSLTKSDFTEHINDIYKYIRPLVFGVPTAGKMVNGFTRFAKSRNTSIQPVMINSTRNLDHVIEFIKEGLKNNYPILMLTWNTKTKNLKYHWVTITGYYKTISEKTYIVTSNWGFKEIFSLDNWFTEKSLYKALVYFR